MTSHPAPPTPAFALVLGIFVVLMSATWFRHTDVGDAQLYQVVARQMLRGGDWLALSTDGWAAVTGPVAIATDALKRARGWVFASRPP